jgi:hypothetical protein
MNLTFWLLFSVAVSGAYLVLAVTAWACDTVRRLWLHRAIRQELAALTGRELDAVARPAPAGWPGAATAGARCRRPRP